jgi:hypothetical protein
MQANMRALLVSRFKVYKGDDVRGKPNNAKATMQKRKTEKKW